MFGVLLRQLIVLLVVYNFFENNSLIAMNIIDLIDR